MEAAEQNVSRICHKIYFPNDTNEVRAPPWYHSKPQAVGVLPTGPVCSSATQAESRAGGLAFTLPHLTWGAGPT